MKIAALFIAFVLFGGVILQAQDVKTDLASATAATGFTVHKKGGDTVFTVRGSGIAGFPGILPSTRLFVNGGPLNGVTGYSSAAGGAGLLGRSLAPKGYAGIFQGRVHVDGRLGIGTSAPTTDLHVDGQVRITGGSPGAGKVLTSDATGLATWSTLSSSGNTLDKAYDEGGPGKGRTINATSGAVTVAGTDGFLSTGTLNSGSIPATGAGVRMMWYPKKAAWRAGEVSGTEWDDANIGVHSLAVGSDVTASGEKSLALGYNLKASGQSAVALGRSSDATATRAVTIGTSLQSTATSAITIGTGARATGQYSIALGSYVETNGKEGAVIIGDHSTTTRKFSSVDNGFTGRFAGGYQLFTTPTTFVGAQLLGNGNSWSSLSDSSRKEGFIPADGEAVLGRFRDLRLGSWNYREQNPFQFRHYGPMAQEWFAAFGHDGIGTIGNDTTLASADVDGVLCIAVQALEKRTTELRTAVEELTSAKNEIARLRRQVSAMEIRLAASEKNSERIDALMHLVRSLQENTQTMHPAQSALLHQEDTQ